jgi:hypothetical protein
MRLHASQRTQSKALELALKLSHVMAPYRKVVDEIEGALAHQGRYQLKLGTKLLLRCENSAPQFLDAAFRSPKSNRSGNLAFCSLLGYHSALQKLRTTKHHMLIASPVRDLRHGFSGKLSGKQVGLFGSGVVEIDQWSPSNKRNNQARFKIEATNSLKHFRDSLDIRLTTGLSR